MKWKQVYRSFIKLYIISLTLLRTAYWFPLTAELFLMVYFYFFYDTTLYTTLHAYSCSIVLSSKGCKWNIKEKIFTIDYNHQSCGDGCYHCGGFFIYCKILNLLCTAYWFLLTIGGDWKPSPLLNYFLMFDIFYTTTL